MRATITLDNLKDRVTIDGNGCWIYNGCKNNRGYGWVTHKGKQQVLSRLVWSLLHGDIPKELYVCHTCDVRSCCNPDHLFTGTARDNRDDMVKKGRMRAFSKITDAQRLEIRNSSKKVRELAALYGLAIGRISDIRNGK